ncbi:MAG: glycosyl hydrolase [Acidobacteriota bacterium]|nr:glycosyl hydrolase [Acidobacteriota bacterium]
MIRSDTCARLGWALLCLVAGVLIAPANADDLEERFLRPTMEDRQWTGPLFWLHGDESSDRLRGTLRKVAEGGNGSFTAESRPHSDWLGFGWYRDLQVCLSEARRLGLKMWIFDERWWPSGEVAGRVPPQYGSKWLEAEAALVASGDTVRLPIDQGHLVAILAGRVKGDAIDGSSLIDLTPRIEQGTLEWQAPDGPWRVMVFTWRLSEGRAGNLLVDGASQDAVDWYIQTVYQPHYTHFGHEFGNLIRGFFYDEPETWGDWGTEVIPTIEERSGDWKRALVAWKFQLADQDEQIAARYAYHDGFAEAWGRTLYGGLTEWCNERSVSSIGHWLEHGREYLHPRLCGGNVFQMLKYSEMGAIDAVFTQFVPGRKDDNTYQTPKLGSSVSHAYGKTDDRAMVEIFGARGQDLSYPEMKWWADHMHASGINFHIPHAFNPRGPYDTDCPPYFYNGGYEPRWPLYRVYADYTTRLSLMLTGGRHICPVALLYLGNSYHVGAATPPEEMTTALQDALYDCDWIPYEVFEGDMRIQGNTLELRDERYRVLIVPAVEALPVATLEKALEYLQAGGIVVGYGRLPSRSATFGAGSGAAQALAEAIWGSPSGPSLRPCRELPSGGRSYFLPERPSVADIQTVLAGDAGVRPTLEVLKGDTGDWLHVLHRQKDDRDIFFLTNMNNDQEIRCFSLRATAAGYPEVWDAMRGEITSVPFRRVGDSVTLPLTLAGGESVLLVFNPQRRALPRRIEPDCGAPLVEMPIRRIDLPPAQPVVPPSIHEALSLHDASWVWHAADPHEVLPCGRSFLGRFHLPAAPAEARLTIAADNGYRVSVNGTPVGSGEAWERPDSYDVARLLHAGENEISILATNGGTGPNPAGIIARLSGRLASGDGIEVHTDGSWASSEAPADDGDGAWTPVRVIGAYGIGPWGAGGGGLTLSPIERPDPYEGTVSVPARCLASGWRVFLVTGPIPRERAARVTVNGVDAGGFIGQPYRLDITRLLTAGRNHLRLEPLAPTAARLVAVAPGAGAVAGPAPEAIGYGEE